MLTFVFMHHLYLVYILLWDSIPTSFYIYLQWLYSTVVAKPTLCIKLSSWSSSATINCSFQEPTVCVNSILLVLTIRARKEIKIKVLTLLPKQTNTWALPFAVTCTLYVIVCTVSTCLRVQTQNSNCYSQWNKGLGSWLLRLYYGKIDMTSEVIVYCCYGSPTGALIFLLFPPNLVVYGKLKEDSTGRFQEPPVCVISIVPVLHFRDREGIQPYSKE